MSVTNSKFDLNLKSLNKPFRQEFNVDPEIISKAKIVAQIVVLRKKNKLTQKELANKIGISQVQLSKIETGKSSPTLETLIKIANYFEKEVSLI